MKNYYENKGERIKFSFILGLIFLLCAQFCNAQSQYKNLDAAGFEKAIGQIIPDAPSDVLKHRNKKTFSYENGLNILAEQNSEKLWSVESFSGSFEVIFPLWKKYADTNADAEDIKRSGTGTTSDRFVRLYKTELPDYWIMEF